MEPEFRLRSLRCSDIERISSLYNVFKDSIQAGLISAYPFGILGALANSMNRSSTVIEEIKTGLSEEKKKLKKKERREKEERKK